MLRAFVACVLSLTAASATMALAEEGDETGLAAEARATTLNGVGMEAFKVKRFAEALRIFKLARELHDRPAIVFNVAQAAYKLSLCREALEAYSAYARAGGGNGVVLKHASDRVAELTQKCGTQAVVEAKQDERPTTKATLVEPPYENTVEFGLGFYAWKAYPNQGDDFGSQAFAGRLSLRIARPRFFRLALEGHFLIPFDDTGRSWVAIGPSVSSLRRRTRPFAGGGLGAGVAAKGGALGYAQLFVGIPIGSKVNVSGRVIGVSPRSAAQSISVGVDLTIVH